VLTSGPNYSEYSHEELLDCLEHIDQDKYPDRYQILLQQIDNRKNGIQPKTSFESKPSTFTLKKDEGIIVKFIIGLKLNTSRLLKTIFILGCISTLLTAILIPQSEEYYGNFVGLIIFIFLCPFLLVYCIHAIKTGEIEVRSFTVKRSESPGYFWFGILLYLLFSIYILIIMFQRTYT
jgi:hypothetical protein